jgi:hypothetical protein
MRPGPAAVAPDGTLAVVSWSQSGRDADRWNRGGETVVTILTPDGDALATWPAPDGLAEWSGVAFDGSSFASLVHAEGAPDDAVAVAVSGARGERRFRFTPPEPHQRMRPYLVGARALALRRTRRDRSLRIPVTQSCGAETQVAASDGAPLHPPAA